MADDPLLSIVVTIVDGGTYTRDFLDALRRLEDAPPLEIIVPFDRSVEQGLSWRDEYSEVQFLELGEIVPERPITSEAGQHELFDRRRAAGLAAATGDLKRINTLLQQGEPASKAGPLQRTPAYAAALIGNLAALELLFRFGADHTPDRDGMTPLFVAARNGNNRCV